MSTVITVSGGPRTLAVPEQGKFRLKDEFQQIPFPAKGATTWTWSTVIGDRTTKELVGVPVALSPVQWDLWPTVGESKEKTIPYLRSHDNITAHVVGDDPGDLDLKLIKAAENPDGTIDCSKLVYFQWTENKDGEKKIPPRANGTCVIALQREEDGANVFVRLSKTSAPVVQRFFSEVAKQGLLPYQTVVSLGLEKVQGSKAPYSRVVPKFVRALEPEFRDNFRDFFEHVSPLLRGSLKKYEKADAVPF